MLKIITRTLLMLLLLAGIAACESASQEQQAPDETASAAPVKKTQALLLTQQADFDPANKNKVEGAYQARKAIDVPQNLTPQNKWIMFEGPVLENDKVAYRYYADSRHRFDIYGKKVSDLVMDTVSWQYHDIMDWGSDILKVGNSLGMGSPGIWFADSIYTLSDHAAKRIEVVENGADKSMVRTTFQGLTIGGESFDLVQDWSIKAGNYWTQIDLYLPSGSLPAGMSFATGIVSHLPEVTIGEANGYTYAMNWGKQSFHKENMGMAVLASTDVAPQKMDDDLSHLLVFTQAPQKVSYRFLAGWEQDQSGTKDATGFRAMVENATLNK